MLDGLMAGSASDAAFWLVLLGVGVIAVLFSLKLMIRQHHDAPRRKPHD